MKNSQVILTLSISLIFLMLLGCTACDKTAQETSGVPPTSSSGTISPTTTPVTTTPSYGGAVIPALEGEGPNDIWLGDYEARPNVLVVERGTTVTFTNQDYWKPITLVSDDGLFAANIEPTGGTFSYVFEDAGTFGYTIDPYSGVWQGAVIVTE